jgi:acetyltransferase-like isoleucine patch superfamily enzyme
MEYKNDNHLPMRHEFVKKLLNFFDYIVINLKDIIYVYFIKNLPGTLGYDVRSMYYRKRFKHFGKGVLIKSNVFIYKFSNVELDDLVNIGPGCHLYAEGGIHIGKYTMLAMNVILMSGNHIFNDIRIPITDQGSSSLPIKIGDDCWLGANVIVLQGVTIGNGCVIGAGSVVTKDIPDYSVAVGNPAKVIKKRV